MAVPKLSRVCGARVRSHPAKAKLDAVTKPARPWWQEITVRSTTTQL